MATNYDFRILIETVSGSQYSYGTGSFVSLDGTSVVLTTSQSLAKINNMPAISYYNGKTFTTSSAALYTAKDNPAITPAGGARTFGNTNIDGAFTDYQFISCSIVGNNESGSLKFSINETLSADEDHTKRYKFFGNKVCSVLGLPENYWIYSDAFRLSNTASEVNYLSGDLLAQSVNIKDNFAISNAGSIETDLPFKHAKDSDRWLKWTDVSSSIPTNDMMLGYSNLNDRYEIRMQNDEGLLISSSAGVTASGNFRIEKDLHLYGNKIYGDDDNNTYIDFSVANSIDFYTNNEKQISIDTAEVTINESGNNNDFRVESNNDARCLQVQGGEDRVGIGMSAANAAVAKLDVRGDVGTHDYGTALFRANTGQTGSISLQSDAGDIFTMAVIENKNTLGIGANGVPNTLEDSDYPLKIHKTNGVSISNKFSATMPGYFSCGALHSTVNATFLGFFGFVTFSDDDSPDTNDSKVRIVAPYDGYVSHLILKAGNEYGGAAKIEFHKATSGENADNADTNTQTGADVTADMSSQFVPGVFNFDQSTHTFSQGDILSFKFTPGGFVDKNIDDIDGMLTLMFDVS